MSPPDTGTLSAPPTPYTDDVGSHTMQEEGYTPPTLFSPPFLAVPAERSRKRYKEDTFFP